MSTNGVNGSGSREHRRDLIVKWHAQGHDALDQYNIARFADGIEYTLAERINLLARSGGVSPQEGAA